MDGWIDLWILEWMDGCMHVLYVYVGIFIFICVYQHW